MGGGCPGYYKLRRTDQWPAGNRGEPGSRDLSNGFQNQGVLWWQVNWNVLSWSHHWLQHNRPGTLSHSSVAEPVRIYYLSRELKMLIRWFGDSVIRLFSSPSRFSIQHSRFRILIPILGAFEPLLIRWFDYSFILWFLQSFEIQHSRFRILIPILGAFEPLLIRWFVYSFILWFSSPSGFNILDSKFSSPTLGALEPLLIRWFGDSLILWFLQSFDQDSGFKILIPILGAFEHLLIGLFVYSLIPPVLRDSAFKTHLRALARNMEYN